MPEVRPERTGWRDEALSQRHRRWGWDCPAADLDFLFLEYDRGKAVAIVEYKNEHAAPQYACHPTYMAMIDLGNKAGLPVFACRYSDDFTKWKAVPLNDKAREFLSERKTLTEQGWVRLLYSICGYDIPQEVLNGIHTEI